MIRRSKKALCKKMNSDNLATLAAIAKSRESGKKIVFTNGCFDILHVGHLRYLNEAKVLGDLLVLGLNSDSSIRRLKGAKRPVLPESERKEMLLGLKSVDYVLIFEEETPLQLIESLKPDVLVKGGDWEIAQIVGSDIVLASGGQVKSLSFFEGHSTTDIIESVLEKYSDGKS